MIVEDRDKIKLDASFSADGWLILTQFRQSKADENQWTSIFMRISPEALVKIGELWENKK